MTVEPGFPGIIGIELAKRCDMKGCRRRPEMVVVVIFSPTQIDGRCTCIEHGRWLHEQFQAAADESGLDSVELTRATTGPVPHEVEDNEETNPT